MECSTSITTDSLAAQTASVCRLKDQSVISSSPSLDYYSGQDSASVSSSIFDFQKAERALQRVAHGPFSKPAPSKWDDAQKWIASPIANRPKTGKALLAVGPGVGARKVGNFGRQPSIKEVVDVPDQRVVAFEEPDTKWIDTSQDMIESGVKKFVGWETDLYLTADSYDKPVLMFENSIAESDISLSRHDSSVAIHSATTFIPPPSTARSVSMRDMGTEMTPIASQEPSRTGTPVRATTPIRSPNSSRPSTPVRAAPVSSPTNPHNDHLDSDKELSEKELHMKTRREIMALGTQLGKMNIAAWASKEEEDKDASTSLKTVAAEQPTRSVIETRAAAWEEAEKAKYMARFHREEMKIQAWENHEKAKTETEMRKMEVEFERMRGHAQDRLMNKLAAARHKAEEKRSEAEAKRDRQAAKSEQQAQYIRRTGRIPSFRSWCSSFSLWDWCS
ncbi:Remorin_C domain-containing protein [Cephalotus follicularis]|uniref:Remorin_C domain-containing protein n=1 Tax=Cephalotus follicularis TaxID=3775 RepID=A0A1Q3BZG3_CEPFO|nr:Remorin_C domain-containing protein [Cephalotus follicularis]